MTILTGYSSAGLPEFITNILLNAAIASSFLPLDIKNLGLSGMKMNDSPANNGIRAIERRNKFQECITVKINKNNNLQVSLIVNVCTY